MKKKIYMIVYTWYSIDARVIREAETLASNTENEVYIITLKEKEKSKSYTLNNVHIEEMEIKKYTGNSGLRYIFSYLHFLIRAFLCCSWRFITYGIDIIHIHNMPNFIVFAGVIPKIFGKKIILDIHDSVPETFMSKFSSKNNLLFDLFCLEEKISCSFANKLICVNLVQKEILVKRGISAKKILISMNVPDPKIFKISPIAVKKNSDCFRIVYHGTITKRLGVDLAIDAVYLLKDKIPGLQLHILGSGEFINECLGKSRILNISDRIIYHGIIPLNELPERLKEMDLGIIPNRYSIATDLMLPVKLMEYIALGIPSVAPRLRCISYYFNKDMLSFFNAGDASTLADAVLEFYKDPQLRYQKAEKARQFLDRYGWDQHKMNLINLYNNI